MIKTLFAFYIAAAVLSAAEPSRERGLSVHMLPDRVAKISGEHGGFTITVPGTNRPGSTFAEATELLAYFDKLPAAIRQNGIWIVTTHPSSYSEEEKAELARLTAICAEKKIPVYTCRAADLPKGWKPAK
jgi:hypothetical protein